MRLLTLLLALALAACDFGGSDVPRRGTVTGVYTLPDGTTGVFSSSASAGGVSSSVLGDLFQIVTTGFSSRDSTIRVGMGIHHGGLLPPSGSYSTRYDDPERPPILANFTIRNVPGFNAANLLDSTTVIVSVPDGTVDVRATDTVLSGTFDLTGQPFGVDDPSLRASLRGQFEIEYEPYRE